MFAQTSELGVTEHIEGDECKFAVWTGRAPISDLRIILKVSTLITMAKLGRKTTRWFIQPDHKLGRVTSVKVEVP